MVGNDHVGTAALGCPGELKKNSTLCHPERSDSLRELLCGVEGSLSGRQRPRLCGEFRLQLKNQWMHHT